MHITRIRLKNWKNFKDTEVRNLSDVIYVIGANASGKSNLLDALRFLRDIAKPRGGGLQDAIERRGGLSRLRCLHARRDPEVLLEIDVPKSRNKIAWRYCIGFNAQKKIPIITRESVTKYTNEACGCTKFVRPDEQDYRDSRRLRQTYLEQINENLEFSELAEFLGEIAYVHLVPQLLKHSDEIGGKTVENDPFGQEFLLRIAASNERTRSARLRNIERGLQTIVPHLQDLKFVKDNITGRPHLEIKFQHHRPHGARQREDQFSDGTLRLISLLWILQESGDAPILLEEPELSLNEEIIRKLPDIITQIRRKIKNKRQILMTTHSQALLSNPGIDADGVVTIHVSEDGSKMEKTSPEEDAALSAGLSVGEVVLPRVQKSSNPKQTTLKF